VLKSFGKKANEVQEKLKSYYDILVLANAVERLPDPHSLDRSFLESWIKHRDRGEDFLLDLEAQAWDSCHGDDYVALSPTTTGDNLAAALSTLTVPWYHKFIGTRRQQTANARHGKVWHYSFRRFVFAGNVLCILLATGIPAGSIVILYVVTSMVVRLCIIAIFCFLFACTMTFVVKAKRVDVFSSTAAFAAVQAVFVGGTTLVQKAS